GGNGGDYPHTARRHRGGRRRRRPGGAGRVVRAAGGTGHSRRRTRRTGARRRGVAGRGAGRPRSGRGATVRCRRRGGREARGGVVMVAGGRVRPPEKVGEAGRSREGPPVASAGEEACDERSGPQDVTNSAARPGGVNLQQEVEPQQTERPPRDSSEEDTRARK